jgi:hypothetical protein
MIVRLHAPRLTVNEYKNLPETEPRYQLIEGDLYTAPAPNRFHRTFREIFSRTIAVHRFEQNPADPIAVWTETDIAASPLLPRFSVNVGSIFRRP